MSDFESSSNSSSGNGSSGNEADSEGEDIASRKDMDELIGMVDRFNPYMFFCFFLFIYLFICLHNMIFTNILLNKFLDFSNEETIHLANAIEVI